MPSWLDGLKGFLVSNPMISIWLERAMLVVYLSFTKENETLCAPYFFRNVRTKHDMSMYLVVYRFL